VSDPQAHDRPALAKRVRLRDDPVTHQPVLLYPEGLLELNETAHAIVALCDGVRTVTQIVESLAAEYEAQATDVAPDVLECLRDLRQRNLIAFES